MGSLDLTQRPKNLCQSSIGMWQRTKQEWVDRSTNAFYNSTNRCQQATTAKWNNSKNRCHRSTIGAWHRSTESWLNSKDRCQQSAKDIVDRSVSKWNQSADQMHQAIRVQQAGERFSTRPEQTKPNPSPPSSPDSPKSTSRFYSQSTATSPVITSPSTGSETSARTHAILPTSVAGSSLSPIEQVRAFYGTISSVNFLVEQTKQLRNDRRHVLGEIEIDWINSTISEADTAASKLAAFIQPYWANHSENTQMATLDRKNWTRRDYPRALKKESFMLLSRTKLETVFGHLEALPVELMVTSAEIKDVESLSSLGISELPVTEVVSVVELPAESTPTVKLRSGLSMSIPKIVVTQYDNEDHETSPTGQRTPPPAYE